MVKQQKQSKYVLRTASEDDEDEAPQLVDIEDDSSEQSLAYDEHDSDLDIAALNSKNGGGQKQDNTKLNEDEFESEKLKQFGLRGINNEERINQRLKEIRANFYNRLESKKLIKKYGRIPFTEHMTISKIILMINECIANDHPLVVPEALTVHDDIKREMAL